MSFTLANVGATQQVTAQITDPFGTVLYGVGVPLWSSADPTIATVDSVGLVTAVAQGTTTITATLGSATGFTAVTVTNLSSFLTEDGLSLLLESADGLATEG